MSVEHDILHYLNCYEHKDEVWFKLDSGPFDFELSVYKQYDDNIKKLVTEHFNNKEVNKHDERI